MSKCEIAMRWLVLVASLCLMLAISASAQNPTIILVAPTDDEVITGNTMTVDVATENYILSCPLQGKPVFPGVGHWHLHIDGQPTGMPGMLYTGLSDMECATQHLTSMEGVAPGFHAVQVILAADNHTELANAEAFKQATIYYKPPLPKISVFLPPGLRVKHGDRFTVKLNWENYTTSCDLFGRALIPGEGHWHVYVDGLDQPHMLDMGCATGIRSTARRSHLVSTRCLRAWSTTVICR
jgi:hypothetical protein